MFWVCVLCIDPACTCNWSDNVTIDPLPPMSDRDRISPYNINTLSTR